MRKIIHVDMDAFYASVEQRNNPALRGKPVIVGGSPNSRGVVSTCSYEARQFGVHSAMPSSKAYRLCPQGIFISHHNFQEYKKASREIREIFYDYTNLVEPLSLDEAYLDVTECKRHKGSATLIAKEICQRIYQRTKLTASAGVSYNKFIAKIASDIQKPRGLTVITPLLAPQFLESLDIRKFFGVGKQTEKKMHNMGIFTGADLKKYELYELIEAFGKAGPYFYNAVRGVDKRPVESSRVRQSMGREHTYQRDLTCQEEIDQKIDALCDHLQKDIEKTGIFGSTLTLKVKYSDFTTITRCTKTKRPITCKDEIYPYLPTLFSKCPPNNLGIRLLGLTLGNLSGNIVSKTPLQLEFNFQN